MKLQTLIDKIFAYGKKQGTTDMEVQVANDSNLRLGLFKGELDNYSLTDSSKLTLKCIYNGKVGTSYTEKIDETSIEMLVNGAIDNAKINNSNDEVIIFEGSESYKDIDTYTNNFDEVSVDKKINYLKEVEKAALSLDKRVSSISHNQYSEVCSQFTLVNTKGLNITKKYNIAFSVIGIIAKDNDSVAANYDFKISRDFNKFNAQEIAEKAVNGAIEKLGASSIASGTYKIIIRNDIMCALLDKYAQIFFADKVQNKLSKLAGKLGKKIADSKLTIVDDPFREDGYASSPFDDQGVACTYKKLVENGVLKNFLYDLETAKKDKVKSTGNANSETKICYTNLIIEKGNKNFDELLKDMDNGLLITGLDGLHAGLNQVSGDLSLLASGFLVENGKKTRPVNQITVSGNFFDMINEIEDIGTDLYYDVPRNGACICPSIRFKSLAVSGK